MATTRMASAHWEGSLMQGAGEVTFDSSGLGTHPVTWPSRAEEPNGRTSPEELIAAAHATGYSTALSHGLVGARTPAEVVANARSTSVVVPEELWVELDRIAAT